MLLNRRETNFWPAYADMMFLLFILFLGISAMIYSEHEGEATPTPTPTPMVVPGGGSGTPLPGKGPELVRCGRAQNFVKMLRECLETGEPKIETLPAGCSIRLGASVLFGFDSDEPSNRPALDKLASCLAKAASKITKTDWLGIESIVIEGHTDCYGDRAYNENLSYRRALKVRDEVVVKLKEQVLNKEHFVELRALITIRPFGLLRRVQDSECECDRDSERCQRDRRVEISVIGVVGEEPRNWEPWRGDTD